MGKKLLIMFLVPAILYQNAFARKHFGAECCEEYCYSTDKDQEQIKHRSSNSAYQLVKGTDYADQYVVPSEYGHFSVQCNIFQGFISDCKPVRFWLLSRHGTRLPEREEVEAISELISVRIRTPSSLSFYYETNFL